MLSGFIGGLIVAWFLSLFGVDGMLIETIQPFTDITLTTSHYYMALAVVGQIVQMLSIRDILCQKK